MRCLQSADKFAIAEIERKLTFSQCLAAPIMLNNKSGEADYVKAIFVIVKRFNDLMNVSKKLNEDQMIALANDLYESFGGESLEDVVLFFKMARTGAFGVDFYRLDTTIILSWLPKYFEVKIESREREIINQRNIRERAENDAVAAYVPDDKAKEKLKELSERLKGTGRRTTVINKLNPLFNYDTYLEELPEQVKKMTDKELKSILDNTVKSHHPEVFEILVLEQEYRKQFKKNNEKEMKTEIIYNAKCKDCIFCKPKKFGKAKRNICTNPKSPRYNDCAYLSRVRLIDKVCDEWKLYHD